MVFLLQGKVSAVIGLYKRMLPQYGMKGDRAKTVKETITYFENNKQYMKYGRVPREGLSHWHRRCRRCLPTLRERPNGTRGHGVEIEGAQAMLSLRALYLNDQWDDFVEYRIKTSNLPYMGKPCSRGM